MNTKFLVLGLAILSLSSCRTPLNVAQIKPEKNISVSKNLQEDQNFKNFIEPYKKEVEGKMNTKISHTSVELNKKGTIAIWAICWQISLSKEPMIGREKMELQLV